MPTDDDTKQDHAKQARELAQYCREVSETDGQRYLVNRAVELILSAHFDGHLEDIDGLEELVAFHYGSPDAQNEPPERRAYYFIQDILRSDLGLARYEFGSLPIKEILSARAKGIRWTLEEYERWKAADSWFGTKALASVLDTIADRLAEGEQPKADDQQGPALTRPELAVIKGLSESGGDMLVTVSALVEALSRGDYPVGESTAKEAIRHLIELGYVERPEGPKKGARLTMKGRRRAAKIVHL